MCGRYVLELKNWIDYQAAMASIAVDVSHVPQAYARYNITPSSLKNPDTLVPIIRVHDEKPEAIMACWTLIPHFEHGMMPTYSTINARIEDFEKKASYRRPWARDQRCIIPATGFYEWQWNSETDKTQPFYIHLADQPHFGFAGLWEESENANGEVIVSCTIMTTQANALMAEIHNSRKTKGKRVLLPPEERRMPVILHQDAWARWITSSKDDAKQTLLQYPSELMVAWPVSTAVNVSRNNSADLIKPSDKPS